MQDLRLPEQFLAPEASTEFYLCDASQNKFNIVGTKSATLLHPAQQDRFSFRRSPETLTQDSSEVEIKNKSMFPVINNDQIGRVKPTLDVFRASYESLHRADQVSGLIHQIET